MVTLLRFDSLLQLGQLDSAQDVYCEYEGTLRSANGRGVRAAAWSASLVVLAAAAVAAAVLGTPLTAWLHRTWPVQPRAPESGPLCASPAPLTWLVRASWLTLSLRCEQVRAAC